MPLVEANGISVNHLVDGPDGAPWITFVAGIAADAAMWEDHVPALSRNYRLLRLDSRGHGGSAATDPPYSFEQLTGDVAGVWDALGIARSHVVGLGLGGMTAVALALRYPRRVSAVVPTACRVELVPEYEAIWPPMVSESAARGLDGIVEATMARWFPDAFVAENAGRAESVRAMIRRTSLAGYRGCIAALLTVGFGDRLGSIANPCLFISGALDRLGGPPDVMRDLAAAVQNGQHVSLPGAGHMCNIASPRAFESALLDFFASL